jgi:uncharacterized alpha/beta hydrolase family protein
MDFSLADLSAGTCIVSESSISLALMYKFYKRKHRPMTKPSKKTMEASRNETNQKESLLNPVLSQGQKAARVSKIHKLSYSSCTRSIASHRLIATKGDKSARVSSKLIICGFQVTTQNQANAVPGPRPHRADRLGAICRSCTSTDS